MLTVERAGSLNQQMLNSSSRLTTQTKSCTVSLSPDYARPKEDRERHNGGKRVVEEKSKKNIRFQDEEFEGPGGTGSLREAELVQLMMVA